MSPQRKGVLRPADEERIQKAVELRALAELELVAAVLDAMKHGASIRETAAASGLSERTIIRWRTGQGLPSFDDWHAPALGAPGPVVRGVPVAKETERMLKRE